MTKTLEEIWKKKSSSEAKGKLKLTIHIISTSDYCCTLCDVTTVDSTLESFITDGENLIYVDIETELGINVTYD